MKKNSSLSSSMATDKISFLPDCLLHHIFSFMDIKLVFQCSVLSKRWRFLWINIPTINFHCPHEDPWNFKLNKKQKIEEESAIRPFIQQVLSRDRSSIWDIKKLTFSSFESNSTIVYHLFHFTETHKVQELSIRLNGNCSIDWSGCFSWVSLEFLKSLSIECLDANLCLEHIFSSCPNLESLALRGYSFSRSNINSSKLKYLHISSYCCLTKKRELVLFTPNLTSFEFESFLPVLKFAGNLPKLDKVKLKVYKSYYDTRRYSEEKENEFVAKKLMALLIELKNVESLTLSSFAAEVLSFLPTSFKVPRDVLQNLTHLKLKINCRRVRMPYQIMSYLLKGSSLDSFIIEQRFSRFN